MPVLTNAQSFAAELLRKLICARHDQLHWLINRKFPEVTPEKTIRQLRYLSRVMDDGAHYLWAGCELRPERIAAIDVMLRICGGALPVFDTARLPCALVFFLTKAGRTQAFRVYTPEPGEEEECRAIAESQRQPEGHASVFLVQSPAQIPLLNISHPHVFVSGSHERGYVFQKAQKTK
ncbi:hypothetical protein FACS1894191_3000 [Clostridia bacterium]|nr:hypothetical protein FACS1894191_3000 [Clostridia bacterium]